MCSLLSVSRGGYYEWIKREPSQRKLRHEFLSQEIKRVYNQHKEDMDLLELRFNFIKKELRQTNVS